jgi:molybdopterin synthase catalytic subunit
MRVTVQFFSYFRQLAGGNELALDVPPQSTVADLLAELYRRMPRLREAEPAMRIAVGLEFAKRDDPLYEADVVSLMPPLQGGADAPGDEFFLTDALIDETETNPGVTDGGTGGVVIFRGVVRALEEGRPIVALEYTAHREMAEHQFRLILAEAHRRWPLPRVRVVHRLGVVGAGETSLLVRVEAAHRAEAFAAAQFIIDELKQKVPIWKEAVSGPARAP